MGNILYAMDTPVDIKQQYDSALQVAQAPISKTLII